MGDTSQGYLAVYKENLKQTEEFLTPDKAGAIQITTIDGTLFTLTTVDQTPPITYTFDLATNQLTRASTSGSSTPSGEQTTLPVSIASPISTYSSEVFHATVVAVVKALATASPIPSIAPGEWESRELRALWDTAYATAIVLYPPPPNYTAEWPTPAPPLTPWPTEPIRAAGAGSIYDDNWGGEEGKKLVIVNKWFERVGNHSLVVFAGRKGRYVDPQQGQVLVAIYDWDGTTNKLISEPELYDTPTRAGYVRVIDAVGERLTLKAEDGTLFYFDVPTHQWVNPP